MHNEFTYSGISFKRLIIKYPINHILRSVVLSELICVHFYCDQLEEGEGGKKLI